MARFCGVCENVADENDNCLCDIQQQYEEDDAIYENNIGNKTPSQQASTMEDDQ